MQRQADDPEVVEIWINKLGRVFTARQGRSELTTRLLPDAQVQDLAERMAKTSGRAVDLSQPFATPSQLAQACA